MREFFDGIEIRRPPLFDGPTSSISSRGSSLSAFLPARNEALALTLLYDVFAALTAITDPASGEGRGFDLVAAHDLLAALAGMTVARSLEIPFILHIHSTEQGRHGGAGSALRQTIERITAARVDQVVTVSYSMQDELISLGYVGSKNRAMYNGVDPAKNDSRSAHGSGSATAP